MWILFEVYQKFNVSSTTFGNVCCYSCDMYCILWFRQNVICAIHPAMRFTANNLSACLKSMGERIKWATNAVSFVSIVYLFIFYRLMHSTCVCWPNCSWITRRFIMILTLSYSMSCVKLTLVVSIWSVIFRKKKSLLKTTTWHASWFFRLFNGRVMENFWLNSVSRPTGGSARSIFFNFEFAYQPSFILLTGLVQALFELVCSSDY